MSWPPGVDSHPRAHRDMCPHTGVSHMQAPCVGSHPTHHGPRMQRCPGNGFDLLPRPMPLSLIQGICCALGSPRGSPQVENSSAGTYLGGGLGNATKRWTQEAGTLLTHSGDLGRQDPIPLEAKGECAGHAPPKGAGHGSTCHSAPFPSGLRASVGRETFS